MHSSLRIIAYFSVGLSGWLVIGSLNVSARSTSPTTPPPLAAAVIQQTEQYYSKLLDDHPGFRKIPNGAEIEQQWRAYLQELRTNWTDTLNSSPERFPVNVRGLTETFQFYFAKRTSFSKPTIATLENPPIPLVLNWTNFAASDQHDLKLLGIQLRVAWFKLLSDLGPKEVFEKDPSSMLIVGMMLQYVGDLKGHDLIGLIDSNDFETVWSATLEMPDFSDAYIDNLAQTHINKFPGKGYFGNINTLPDRVARYESIARPLKSHADGWYYSGWENNPPVFESRMRALDRWINDELDHAADVLAAGGKVNEGKSQLAAHYVNFLDQAMRRLTNAGPANGAIVSTNSSARLSKADLVLVRELNEHLHYDGQQFNADYASQFEKALTSLRSNHWTDALNVPQPDKVSENLTLPFAVFGEYAKRSTNGEFGAAR